MLSQKEAFRLPSDLHYINCAYMGPLPQATEEVGIRCLRRKRNPVDIVPEDFFRDSDELRSLFARLVHADPGRIAIMPSASYGVATACLNLPLGPGRKVVMAGEQFPGNVYSWRSAAARQGGTAVMVDPPDAEQRGREWNTRLLEAIGPDTAVVALGSVHWTDGTRFDLEAIGARAREVGAALVVDGTQSVGAVPFDVSAVQPDALICAGYKWLLGPYAVALGYFGPRFDHGLPLEETWIARKGSEDFKGLVEYVDEYQPGAVRFDVGERANFILVPMQVASLKLVLEWTPEAIQRYTEDLTRDMLVEAAELGYGVEESAYRSPHLFGVKMPAGLDLRAVRDALARRNVIVSLRGSSLRVSPHLYNDRPDVEALLEVLREVREL
jgi:selenocysteine lyase/cysteine desulfurase